MSLEAYKRNNQPAFKIRYWERPTLESITRGKMDFLLTSAGTSCDTDVRFRYLRTGALNAGVSSDISDGGCYVEMPFPLSGQSGVEILVRTSEMKLKIRGQVLATHPGFGVGVRFMFRDSVEREEILRLLAVLSAGPSLDEIPLYNTASIVCESRPAFRLTVPCPRPRPCENIPGTV